MTLTQTFQHNPSEENGVSTMQIGKHTIYMTSSDDCQVAGVKHLDITTALKFATLLRDEDVLKANGLDVKRICDVRGYARCLELFVDGILLNKRLAQLVNLLPERHIHGSKEKIIIC